MTGRVGGIIRPYGVVVHTTDTLAGTKPAIVKSWSTTVGNGACAHFIIGRAGDITQMVSIYRNGNHAGGPIHGNFRTPTGKLVHPNTVTVGIEIESGGLLKKTPFTYPKPETTGPMYSATGKVTASPLRFVWVHPDTKRTVPDADVHVDATGRGWQRVTEDQLSALGDLLKALKPCLATPEPGTTVVPDGDYKANGVSYYAPVEYIQYVGHATLDPVNKTDPGPQVMHWLDIWLTGDRDITP